MVAPDAYQKGPETPCWKATLDDWASPPRPLGDNDGGEARLHRAAGGVEELGGDVRADIALVHVHLVVESRGGGDKEGIVRSERAKARARGEGEKIVGGESRRLTPGGTILDGHRVDVGRSKCFGGGFRRLSAKKTGKSRTNGERAAAGLAAGGGRGHVRTRVVVNREKRCRSRGRYRNRPIRGDRDAAEEAEGGGGDCRSGGGMEGNRGVTSRGAGDSAVPASRGNRARDATARAAARRDQCGAAEEETHLACLCRRRRRRSSTRRDRGPQRAYPSGRQHSKHRTW